MQKCILHHSNFVKVVLLRYSALKSYSGRIIVSLIGVKISKENPLGIQVACLPDFHYIRADKPPSFPLPHPVR